MHMVGALEMSKIMSQVIVGYRTPPSIKKGNIFLKRLPPHPPLPPHYNVGGWAGGASQAAWTEIGLKKKKSNQHCTLGGGGGEGAGAWMMGGAATCPSVWLLGSLENYLFLWRGGLC